MKSEHFDRIWKPDKYPEKNIILYLRSTVELWFSEREPSGKPRLSGNFSEHQFSFI